MELGAYTLEKEAFSALERNDGQKALELFLNLADLGSDLACYAIGDIYLFGQGGVQINVGNARRWFERALGSPHSKISQRAALKLEYIYGAGYDDAGTYRAAIDHDKAFYYYKKLENSNNPIGLLRLGVMYEMGWGTPKDERKAMELYYRSAKLGNLFGQKNLGVLKLKSGNIPYGFLLWVSAALSGYFLVIFRRKSPRIRML